MDYDARGFASAADGTKLFYGTRGVGPPLLLLDGIGCDGWAWNHIQPHLSERHRVVHTHYRGHGRSGPPADRAAIGIETLSEDALRVMDAAGLERSMLVAHSMGTQVALEMVRREPARASGLILICGSFGRITHTFHGNDILYRVLPGLIEQVQKHHLLSRALWGRLPPSLAFKVAGWLGEIDSTSVRAEDFAQYVEHLSDIDLDLYLGMLQQAGEHSAQDMLARVTVPVLVIAAEKDTFTPRDTVAALAQAIPDAQYLELTGATHAAPAERADHINQRIDLFLADAGWV